MPVKKLHDSIDKQRDHLVETENDGVFSQRQPMWPLCSRSFSSSPAAALALTPADAHSAVGREVVRGGGAA